MIGACHLDADGLATQRDRYRALAAHATGTEREPRRLTVRVGDGLDEALLRETVAIERACCPFFTIETGDRELVVAVGDAEHEPALDAIAHALG